MCRPLQIWSSRHARDLLMHHAWLANTSYLSSSMTQPKPPSFHPQIYAPAGADNLPPSYLCPIPTKSWSLPLTRLPIVSDINTILSMCAAHPLSISLSNPLHSKDPFLVHLLYAPLHFYLCPSISITLTIVFKYFISHAHIYFYFLHTSHALGLFPIQPLVQFHFIQTFILSNFELIL